MRILYIICGSGILGAALLWLGFWRVLSRKVAASLACLSMLAGGGMLLLAVLPGNSFYGPVLTQVLAEKKLVALTFDDGPYPPYTQQLLKVLDEEKIKATFFLVAEKAEKFPELIKQEVEAGHELALHSYIHKDQLKLEPEAIQENLEQGKAALEKLSGTEIKFFRPPHGFKDWAVMENAARARLEVVNWSVIPRDWTNPGAEVIEQRVLEKIAPGAIVLLHDGDSPHYLAPREQTVRATREIIHKLRAQGYSFVTISELKKQGGH